MAARWQALQAQTSRLRDQEEEMRAIDCPCGHRLDAVDDQELLQRAREHIAEHHPEMQRSNEQIRERVAADAYDVETVT
jgi:predicted small metal-binding protein